ncbi:MAG TPA: D-alanyl-D-alanine endopeptidase [Solimonas sp.]|nr:D-alanyl-D-alanine endopeptidase [Solimonas sp.]
MFSKPGKALASALLACSLTLVAGGASAASTAEASTRAAPQTAKAAVKKKATAKRRAATTKKKASSKRKVRSGSRNIKKAVRRNGSSPLSTGQKLGLRGTGHALNLKSSVALVVDQNTGEVLVKKNADAVLPIASLTKLMTALVVLEAAQPLDELLTISVEDVDTEKHSHSRLAVGNRLSREELLLLALMSSENRAAHALGRHYPGGLQSFVAAMNAKAWDLGMLHSHFADPTGLSSRNTASASDLVRLVNASYRQPLIRSYSTRRQHTVMPGRRAMTFNSSNRLIRYEADWDIGLQKTGFTNEAGRCLVMQAQVEERPLVMIFLDSSGSATRFADAQRVRHWVEAQAVSERADAGLPSS